MREPENSFSWLDVNSRQERGGAEGATQSGSDIGRRKTAAETAGDEVKVSGGG